MYSNSLPCPETLLPLATIDPVSQGQLSPPVQNAATTSTTGGTLAAATYYYVVTALNANGETLKSNEQSVTTTGTTSSNTVNWAAVAGATGYRIYRGTATGAENVFYAVGAVTSFVDTGAASTAGTPPVANTAAITAATAWFPVQNFHSFLALIDVGVFGALATVDAKLMQAKDNTGTGAKALTNASTGAAKAITQLLAAGGNNRVALINARISDLDQTNGYGFIQLQIVPGTAASLVSGALFGLFGRFDPGQDLGANPTFALGAANIAQLVN